MRTPTPSDRNLADKIIGCGSPCGFHRSSTMGARDGRGTAPVDVSFTTAKNWGGRASAALLPRRRSRERRKAPTSFNGGNDERPQQELPRWQKACCTPKSQRRHCRSAPPRQPVNTPPCAGPS